MTAKSVDRGIVAVWRWHGIGTGVAILAGGSIPLASSPLPLPLVIGSLSLLFVAIAVAVTWYPPARYRHLAYRVEPGGILVRDGVFFRGETFVARVRIQHTDVFQGPLQRHYGVAVLKLYTAGSRFTKIELPGLAHDDALALRDELQREGDDDAV